MLREQFEGIARTLPFTLIVIGGGGGALIALANLIRLAQALRQGEPAGDLLWPLLSLAVGALLAAYFGYLATLKRALRRDGR
jgi:hypothetical protein